MHTCSLPVDNFWYSQGLAPTPIEHLQVVPVLLIKTAVIHIALVMLMTSGQRKLAVCRTYIQ